MKLPKLYKKTQNGKTVYLELSTKKVRNKDWYEMITKTGTVGEEDKEKMSKILVKEGKNIGRSNETSPKEQSENQIKSTWSNNLYKGYSDNLKEVQLRKYNKFPDNSVMPMLLNKYNEKVTEGFMQRKYDGVRCIAERVDGEIRLKSREGKIFDLSNILQQVTKLMNNQVDCTFDGEIYLHGEELHDIISAVKNGDPNEKLNYVIYDVLVENLEFFKRRNALLAIETKDYENIQVDYGVAVKTEEEIKEFHTSSIEQDYEGSILCKPNSVYDFGFRTGGKMKIKPRVTDEFECIDHYFNKGKMAEESTLVCKTVTGKTFHVKMKGTHEQRVQWAEEFDDKFKNKMVTVEFRKLSKYNTPIEAVGITVRDYE